MYIVIEKYGGPKYAYIIMDEEGNNMLFDTFHEATIGAEQCQDAIVVKL